MRIFKNCEECINEMTREVFARGMVTFDPTAQQIVHTGNDYETKELIGENFMILDTTDANSMFAFSRKNFIYKEWEPQSIGWADAWWHDRLEGIHGRPSNPETSYRLRPKYWSPFLENGKFAYSYPERYQNNVKRIIEALKKNRYKRGACIAVWDREIDSINSGNKRVPCSMYYQILIRPKTAELDQLYMIYNIRSQDLANHFASDVYLSVKLQKFILEELKPIQKQRPIILGPFIEFVGSLHAYRLNVNPERLW